MDSTHIGSASSHLYLTTSLPLFTALNSSMQADGCIITLSFNQRHQRLLGHLLPVFASVFAADHQPSPHRLSPRTDGNLGYLHTRFFSSQPTCTTMQFQEFWRWLGPVLQTLKYTRHINEILQTGVILGFFQRSHCDQLLIKKAGGYESISTSFYSCFTS